MFDVKILLDECNIIYTSEQLEKLKGLIEEEIFKIILPEEKSTENSEMSMTEDHTSNENENQNENQIQNQNFSDNDNDNDNQGYKIIIKFDLILNSLQFENLHFSTSIKNMVLTKRTFLPYFHE